MALEGIALEGIVAAIAGFMILAIFIALGVYIYTSLAFMSIARKNKQDSPGLAWIPAIGPMIIAYKGSKMHWWPWLLFIGLLIPIVNFICSIAISIFFVIWQWKLFEEINQPGWWSLFAIIPLVNIIYFVFLGIAAWSKD